MLMKYVANAVSASALKSCRVAGAGSGSCPWSRISPCSPFFDAVKMGVRYAGHSKWQNIKHTKLAKDVQKNQLYNRHIEEIRRAIREGKGTNPKNNVQLAKCLEAAKKDGVATTTIAGVIQKLEKALLNPKSILFEYRGSHGVLVIVTANTDNRNRTRSDINFVTKRHGLVKAENITSAFSYKGYVYAKPAPDTVNADEKALDDAIEVGAEEVQRDEENSEILVFKCDGADCSAIRSKLESRNYLVQDSEELFEPRNAVELDEDETKKYYEAFEKLDEIPEVNGIYTNLQ
ncbi:probable transcriptional regulatory protein TT_C0469 [Planococcus citri]|uniref:probable transcriptional regulatory protein TT_C0469 n=1 Tax=Planococcus citri TaxID=170843 RepID=UPI0031F73760